MQHELDSLEQGLIEEFCPPLNPDEVRRCCAEAIASLDSSEIHSYIVVLVEHEVRQKLRRRQAARVAAAVNRHVGTVEETSSPGGVDQDDARDGRRRAFAT